MMGTASLRRCEVYAIGPESGVSSKPRANPVTAHKQARALVGGTRAEFEFALKDQKLVMEATSGLEPE